MPPDMDALAAEVVRTLSAALAPVKATLAAVQDQVKGFEARWSDLGALRERVAVVESKVDQPVPVVLRSEEPDIAPVLERLAVSEQANRDIQARVLELVGLRDRLVTVETKAAQPVVNMLESAPVDLVPVLERVAAAEARLAVLGDLRDRVVTVETKVAEATAAIIPATPDPPAPVDLTPVFERLAGAEARLSVLGDLRDRVVTVETKAALPVGGAAPVDLGPVIGRLSALELGLEMKAAETGPILGAIADLTKDVGAVRERLAVVEVRPSLPGPQGEPGLAGKDGADGLGFEDIDVSLSGDRTLVFRLARGDQEKTFRVIVGWPVYQKNWVQGKAYVAGDVVTWDGSEWQCLAATDVDIPGVSNAWYRSVTKGRAGAPGRDGKDWTPPPVVSVGAPR